MKRLLTIILIMILVVPAAALADDDTGLFIGTWCRVEYLKDGTLSFQLFDIQEDHTAISVFASAGENIGGRSFIGSWKETPNGIHVISGQNTTKDFFLADNGFIAEKAYSITTTYSRIRKYDKNDTTNGPVPLSMLETGVQIPTGTYIIGTDIPAGVYRFDMNKTAAYVSYYKKETDILPSTSFNLNTRSETYARLELKEGGIIKIENGSVILSYAKKLFE